MHIPSTVFSSLVAQVAYGPYRSATKFMAPDFIVRVTRQFKPSRREGKATLVLTIGKPNYSERQFIKQAVKAGEPFPVKRYRLRPWPVKRGR